MSLTWAGVILFNRSGELLLLQRDNIPTIGYPDHWNLAGGVVEEGETPETAAVREVREEIDVRLAQVSLFRRYEIGTGGRDNPVPYYVYWAHLDRGLAELTLGEGQAMRFFDPEELPALRMVPHDAGILQEFITSPYYVSEAS